MGNTFHYGSAVKRTITSTRISDMSIQDEHKRECGYCGVIIDKYDSKHQWGRCIDIDPIAARCEAECDRQAFADADASFIKAINAEADSHLAARSICADSDRAILDAIRRELPVGYIPNSTDKDLPEMVAYHVKRSVLLAEFQEDAQQVLDEADNPVRHLFYFMNRLVDAS